MTMDGIGGGWLGCLGCLVRWWTDGRIWRTVGEGGDAVWTICSVRWFRGPEVLLHLLLVTELLLPELLHLLLVLLLG